MSEDKVEKSVSMKSIDSSRQDHYTSKLEEFRKKQIHDENYEDYVQEVDGFIENIREIISDELDERTKQIERKNKIVEEDIGEDSLSDIREKGPGRWNFDVLQVSEVDRGLKEKNWKLFELAWFLFQNTWVEKQKLESVLDEMDMQSISSRYFEKHEDMIEKDREMTKKQFKNLVSGLREIEDSRNENMQAMVSSIKQMAETLDDFNPEISVNTNSGDVEKIEEENTEEKNEKNNDESDNDGDDENNDGPSNDLPKCRYCRQKFLNKSNRDEHEDDACDRMKEIVYNILDYELDSDGEFSAADFKEKHPISRQTVSNWRDNLKEGE